MEQFKRIEIMIGWICNNNCIFCAESDNRKHAIVDGNLVIPYGEICTLLETWRGRGAEHVTFLGGEPTLHKDIMKIVHYAKQIGYRIRFFATNARMFSYESAASSMVEAGLNEVSVSIHGHEDKMHEASTRVRGSFLQTVQGLDNLIKYCDKVMTNTTINIHNYKHLDQIMEFLIPRKLSRILITYPHLTGGASEHNVAMVPRISEVSPYIHRAIDAVKNKIKIRVMNVPFCLMQGYEEYIDSIGFADRVKIGSGKEEKYRYVTGKDYVQPESCGACRFREQCPGIHASYLAHFSHDEYIPIYSI